MFLLCSSKNGCPTQSTRTALWRCAGEAKKKTKKKNAALPSYMQPAGSGGSGPATPVSPPPSRPTGPSAPPPTSPKYSKPKDWPTEPYSETLPSPPPPPLSPPQRSAHFLPQERMQFDAGAIFRPDQQPAPEMPMGKKELPKGFASALERFRKN
jgi:hypothetical protein